MGTNHWNTWIYEHILIQFTTVVLVIVCSEILSQLENLHFMRKPGRLPTTDLCFSCCYLRFNPTVSSPTLQQDPQFQSPMEPTDLSLLTSYLFLCPSFQSKPVPLKTQGLPIHTFHSVPPDAIPSPQTCCCLPFLDEFIHNGSQRSFPIFLPPAHAIIPASNTSRNTLGAHQLSRPGK